jgi:hypothetical protein
MEMLKKGTFLVVMLGLLACGSNDDCEQYGEVGDAEITLDFTDLTHQIHELSSIEEMREFFSDHPIIRDQFFEYGTLQPEAAFHAQVLRLISTPKVQEIYRASSVESLEALLNKYKDIRDILAYPYLSAQQGRSLNHLHEILRKSTITQVNDLEKVGIYLDNHPVEYDLLSKSFGFVTAAELDQENFETLKNPYVDTLYQEVIRLTDVGQLRFDLDRAYKRLEQNYPDFDKPEIQTVYSGFGSDIFISDSLLVIGLDYYLGEEASLRPNVYDYLKVRLTPEHLVPQIMQFTSLKFNKTNEAKRSLLDEMIYYGKALEFSRELLPCVDEHLIMGYSPQQLADAYRSEGVIWNYFLDNQLIYSEKPIELTRYIDERPAVPEIDKICPGRIGQWVGWQIVKAYREETGIDFDELMAETDAQKILRLSKYRPRLR